MTKQTILTSYMEREKNMLSFIIKMYGEESYIGQTLQRMIEGYGVIEKFLQREI